MNAFIMDRKSENSKNPEVGFTEELEMTTAKIMGDDDIHWWKQPGLRRLYLLMPFLFLGSTTLGFDGSLLNGLQAMPTWKEFFNDPSGSLLGLYGAMPGFGGLVVLLFAPYVADYLGRRNGTALGNLFVLIGAILQAVTPASSPKGMYLAGRFLVGFGSNISNGTCPLLITEVSHPRHRGRITTIYNTLWYLGSIIAAWTTYGTLIHLTTNLQWRLPSGLQCLMPGIQILALYLVPESPRYHIARGQPERARQMLIKYHGNGQETQFVQWEFEEISNTIRLEQEAAASSGWAELVRTAGNRKRCILIVATAIFSQCSGNSLVSYYLVQILTSIGITDPTHQSLFNGGLTIWCFLVALGFAFTIDKFGRRTLFLTAGIGMLISFVIWTACAAMYEKTGNQAYGNVVLAMIFLFYTVAGAAWPGLTVSYTVELLPYKIRAKGLTLCFCFTALSGVFNQYVNPIGLKALGWKFYFVYIAVLIFQVIMIYFYFVETKGLPLEEISRVIDGDAAAAAVVADNLAHRGKETVSRRPSAVVKHDDV